MTINRSIIPFYVPDIGDDEIKEVVDTLKSGWITTGPKVKIFEKQLAEYFKSKHVIAVSSATAAMHLSLHSLGINTGDEVITTPLTFAATVHVILHVGAKPVLADIRPEDLNIDPEEIYNKITPKTKAIIPVHYAGYPCNMTDIINLSKKGIKIIEDCAHAMGTWLDGKHAGTFGDTGCFSFYAQKNMTTAEGGCVVLNDDQVAHKIRLSSLHGMSRDAWKRYSSAGNWYYEVEDLGFKYNMTDIQASIGIHQLKKLEQMNDERRYLANLYDRYLSEIREITTINNNQTGIVPSRHIYPILLNLEMLKIDRNGLIELLKEQGVLTSVHFIPIHYHPFFRSKTDKGPGDFPISEMCYERILSLPLYPKMSSQEIETVVLKIKDIIAANRK